MKKIILGQSLFEVVVALAVVALLIVGLVNVTTISVRNSSFSNVNNQATRHAQAAGDWLRGERDAGWSTFVGRGSVGGGIYCLDLLAWNSGSCQSTEFIAGTTNFKREVTLTCYTAQGVTLTTCSSTDINIDTVSAVTNVSWTDGQGTHTVTTPVLLTKWEK